MENTFFSKVAQNKKIRLYFSTLAGGGGEAGSRLVWKCPHFFFYSESFSKRTFKKLNIQTSKTEHFLGHPVKESQNESFVLPVIV